MDKQREEFLVWHHWEFNYHPDDITITEELRQLAWQRELGWQAAKAVMQPDIDSLASDKDELNDLAEKQEQQLSAANQRNKELEATLNQVRSTYNQIIAEDTATRNEYLDEIAKLESNINLKQQQNELAVACIEREHTKLSADNQRIQELLDLVEVVERRNKQLEDRIRVADAEEPVYVQDTTSLSLRIIPYRGNATWTTGWRKLYLHAQIPSEVELKAKIAELEAIIDNAANQRIAELEQRLNSFRGIEKRERLLMERVAELEELGNSSLDLLCLMYSLWEEGQPCYEGYDEKINDGLFIGNAFKLDEGVENKIIAMLNKHRPVVHNLT